MQETDSVGSDGYVAGQPLAFILEIDETVLMLDCGWSEDFDEGVLGELVTWAPRVHAVLVSHSDVAHLGALPYLVAHGLEAPIYATLPVAKMGEMFMYDAYLGHREVSDFAAFTLDDVDAAFGRVEQLRYSQRVEIPGANGLEITPFASGHTVGGAVWKIQRETEEIVYAVDFNHKKERHLNGTVLETFRRPSVLITDALNARTPQDPLRDRNKQLEAAITGALDAGGNVLLPCDSAGRVLELLLGLEQQLAPRRGAVPVVFLTHVAPTTAEFARSQLEWMSDTVLRMFDYHRANPFKFKLVEVHQSLKDVDQLPSPKVVLASAASLEVGMAKELFLKWASNPRSLVLLTERAARGSLADRLRSARLPQRIEVVIKKRVPLAGQELADFYAEKARKEQEERDAFAQGTNTAFIAEGSAAVTEMMDAMLEPEARPSAAAEPAPAEGALAKSLAAKFAGGHDWIVDRSARQVLARSSLVQGTPMFPFEFKRLKFDVWGAEPDLPEEKPVDAEAAAVEPEDEAAASEDEAEETPTKCIVEHVMVHVMCAVRYIDFEGRSDGRSAKQIINHMAPRKLVLVRATRAAAAALREHVEVSLENVCRGVEMPARGQTVDITIDTNIFKLQMKEALNAAVELADVGQYQVAYVSGVLRSEPGADLPLLEPLRASRPHDAVFVGDVRLADLREALIASNFHVELMAGVLVCNRHVLIRKVVIGNHSKLLVNGVVSEDTFRVQEFLLSRFNVLC